MSGATTALSSKEKKGEKLASLVAPKAERGVFETFHTSSCMTFAAICGIIDRGGIDNGKGGEGPRVVRERATGPPGSCLCPRSRKATGNTGRPRTAWKTMPLNTSN